MQGKGVRIVVRGEPFGKGRPKLGVVAGHAHAFTPAKTRTKEGIITTAATDAMNGRPPFSAPLCFSLVAVMAVPQSWSQKRKRAALAGEELPAKRPDLDNCLKAVLDAMNTVVFTDDALIVEIRARKVYGQVPQTIVEVWPDEGRAAQ